MNTDTMVYEAERVLYFNTDATRFSTIKEAQDYLDHVKSTRFFVGRWPDAGDRPIVVKLSKRYDWAGSYVDKNKIMLPVWAMNDLVLLHELAHFCKTDFSTEDHDAVWCGSYLSLVGHFVNKAQAKSLMHSFRAYGVDYIKP